MPCRVRRDLEQFLASAEEADSPDLLSGLSERALVNRQLQKEEKISRQKLLLEKHQQACEECSRPE